MCISIIIPCFNEAKSIDLLYTALSRELVRFQEPVEIIFIDDGSSDGTLDKIKSLHQTGNIIIHYISFSRNFGKEAAMLAGMKHARGDYIAIMDADLQDDPHLLVPMYEAVRYQGFDCAAVRRASRKNEPPIRSFFARLFYKVMGKLAPISAVDGERDYRMMTRQMVNAVLSLQECTRYSKGLFSWVGFHTMWIEEDYCERAAGTSKWSFRKLCLYAIDAITSFSTVPLAISSLLGVLLFFLSIVGIAITIIRQLIWGGSAYGWSSLVCIILLISGIQLFCMGILGQYLAKTYTEVKNRPAYIIREKSDDKKE